MWNENCLLNVMKLYPDVVYYFSIYLSSFVYKRFKSHFLYHKTYNICLFSWDYCNIAMDAARLYFYRFRMKTSQHLLLFFWSANTLFSDDIQCDISRYLISSVLWFESHPHCTNILCLHCSFVDKNCLRFFA